MNFYNNAVLYIITRVIYYVIEILFFYLKKIQQRPHWINKNLNDIIIKYL